MVDAMLEFMLGPLRGISDFYLDYQIYFNTVIVGFALYKILFNKKKAQESTN
nr:hypothetical protein [Lentibacillus amyloliquefaciens]